MREIIISTRDFLCFAFINS